MDVTVEIKGLQEAEARLLEIAGLGSGKIIARALRRAAKPMATAAQQNAVGIARSGALARSVGVVNRRPKGAEVAKVAVTSRAKDRTALWMHNTAYKRTRRGIFYGWMVDQGTVRSRARPWWTPAVNSTQDRAVSSFIDELRKAIARIERRNSKTANPDSVIPA